MGGGQIVAVRLRRDVVPLVAATLTESKRLAIPTEVRNGDLNSAGSRSRGIDALLELAAVG